MKGGEIIVEKSNEDMQKAVYGDMGQAQRLLGAKRIVQTKRFKIVCKAV